MISVIVPVYNVEPYLRKCLDSIVNQTYRDLEILVIDDGSTDGCGKICDEYKKKDERIRVFHTENRGLSCARNRGLDEARGEWIGFVDSDDWIEPDMYEMLLKRAEETEADVVECGVYKEFQNKKVALKNREALLAGKEAVAELLKGRLLTAVMNKIWKYDCIKTIRFPEDRVYEDISTTYRVFYNANKVSRIDECKYHYFLREGSITDTNTAKKLVDLWTAQLERFNYLDKKNNEEYRDSLLRVCAKAIIKMWIHFCDFSMEEQNDVQNTILDMHEFTKKNYSLLGCNEWEWPLRIGIIFPRFLNKISFHIARCAYIVYKAVSHTPTRNK